MGKSAKHDLAQKIERLKAGIKELTPEHHHGNDDPSEWDCDETCKKDEDGDCVDHLPGEQPDRCDKRDECYRCIALDLLEET